MKNPNTNFMKTSFSGTKGTIAIVLILLMASTAFIAQNQLTPKLYLEQQVEHHQLMNILLQSHPTALV
jgi:hypothetical protein